MASPSSSPPFDAFAPEPIRRAALALLSRAAAYTRACACSPRSTRRQVNDLWETLRDVPPLLAQWPHDGEHRLRAIFRRHDARWPEPHLEAIYDRELEREKAAARVMA